MKLTLKGKIHNGKLSLEKDRLTPYLKKEGCNLLMEITFFSVRFLNFKNNNMSREIKFRAWDESQKYMAYQGTPDLETIQSFMHHFGDKKLLQFTGLKDYQGKEIYDGDIVQVEFTHASWWWLSNPQPTGRDGYSGSVGICQVDDLGRAVKIWFPKKDFWFERYKDLEDKINRYHLKNVIDVNYQCKVIGNIYENPELVAEQS